MKEWLGWMKNEELTLHYQIANYIYILRIIK